MSSTKPQNANAQYDGGYYLIRENLIHGGLHGHTSWLETPVSQVTLDAVNVIQSTPWRINTWILDLARQMWDAGDTICGIPSVFDRPRPQRLDDAAWAAMEADDKKQYKKRLAEIHDENASLIGSRNAFLSKLQIAEDTRGQSEIYFPHFVDFRTRIYPMTQDLHPQGDDLTKALLMFAQGKALGPQGLYWLAVRLANCYGQDKLPLDERVSWVYEHHHLIIDSANDPLDGQRFWCATNDKGDPVADEPWGFLATCREWTLAHELQEPYDFVSHLPIPMDGSCNGLQHLSLMGRDSMGARATNCMDSGVRQDIYEEVAAVVRRLVTDDAISGVPEAQAWVGKISRKVVKRAVMTTPYGVTERGIRDQLMKDGHTKDIEEVRSSSAADYLRDKIVVALSQTVNAAKDIMALFQTWAKELAEAGHPFEWTTPVGNKVRQSYYNLARKKVLTLMGEVYLWEENPLLGLNVKKQTLAAAPNVIHSFDAAHVVMTVNAAAREGIEAFAMIHDSFGTHAADTQALARVLRDQAVVMYQTNWLEQIEQEIQAAHPEVQLTHWEDVVTMGDFDVELVRLAPFFFA